MFEEAYHGSCVRARYRLDHKLTGKIVNTDRDFRYLFDSSASAFEVLPARAASVAVATAEPLLVLVDPWQDFYLRLKTLSY